MNLDTICNKHEYEELTVQPEVTMYCVVGREGLPLYRNEDPKSMATLTPFSWRLNLYVLKFKPTLFPPYFLTSSTFSLLPVNRNVLILFLITTVPEII
jgi:hypothetical protein